MRVELLAQDDGLVVSVVDDGCGLAVTDLDTLAADGHYGLVGMRERARRTGGTLDVRARKRGGTTLQVRIPSVRAGVVGYLVHGRFTPEELYDAVRDAAVGKTVISPAVAPVVFDALRRRGTVTSTSEDPTALTERESEVMALVARGLTNVEIAERLYVSHKTVKNHLNRVYTKLGLSRRAEAIAHWLGTK